MRSMFPLPAFNPVHCSWHISAPSMILHPPLPRQIISCSTLPCLKSATRVRESSFSSPSTSPIRAGCGPHLQPFGRTGWPSRGGKVGAGVASVQDELIALQKLNCAAQNTTTYAFEYNDQLWKSSDNERSFGIWGKIQGFTSSC
jgi:hypothetical protein